MKYLATLTAAVFLLAAASCTKEKRFENNLTKRDGVWNIDNMTWTNTEQGTSGQTITTGTETNTGTFTFSDNGNLSYNYTFGGTQKTGTFHYAVSEESFSVTALAISIFGTISQTIVAYRSEERRVGKECRL